MLTAVVPSCCGVESRRRRVCGASIFVGLWVLGLIMAVDSGLTDNVIFTYISVAARHLALLSDVLSVLLD